ncbi:MAG: ribonuclease III [Ruminococcaceae bacterium]|jgi:ribonuclease-3|nr:ribonuclease III [Oscillospiraceae bacterium]
MPEEIMGYRFKDPSLLHNALCHSSYANEHRGRGEHSNERLEFLGDAVLGVISAEYIYGRFTELPEGEMTKLRASIVCEQSLYEFACQIGLGELLLLGRGEINGGGNKRPSVLADAVEAVLAAIYLDGGMDAAKGFILDFIKAKAEVMARSHTLVDYKTTLQEIVQKNHQETLSYKVKSESGPDHDKLFVIEVYINSNPIAEGQGKSKKQAEQAAARAALELMGEQ